MELTQEILKALLSYDPLTGHFFWLKAKGRRKFGMPAGCVDSNRVYIGINGVVYLAHRLAWLYMTGAFPIDQIDHINCDSLDNKFANLREANKSENMQNRVTPRADNKSGFLGVSWVKRDRKWTAHIQINGKAISLGNFTDAEDAHAAYIQAKRRLHPFGTL